MRSTAHGEQLRAEIAKCRSKGFTHLLVDLTFGRGLTAEGEAYQALREADAEARRVGGEVKLTRPEKAATDVLALVRLLTSFEIE